MAEQRKIRRKTQKKKPGTQRKRRELRFQPKTTQSAWLMFGLGMLGALALGAGVFGQWVKDPPIDYSAFLVAGGAIGLGIALWAGDLSGVPVRVGDAGIALEKAGDVVRMAWCAIERISVDGGQLVAKGDDLTFSIPIAAHPQATAWILKEGVQRIPNAVDVKRRAIKELPKPDPEAGEELKVEGIQVAGRHCRESDVLISFERDARLCPNCCEVYHRQHVPKVCATCEQPLGERALTA